MNKKSLLLLVSLLGIAAIPQLLYYWLAPGVACGKVVYWFGTVFTVAHLGLCYYLWQTYAARRAAAFVLVGSSILLCAFVAGALFLAIGAAVRTAAYALAVIAVLYVVCSGMLIAPLLAERAEREPAGGNYAAYEPEYGYEPEPTEAEEPRVQNRAYIPPQPSQPMRETRASAPLPPARASNPPPLPGKR